MTEQLMMEGVSDGLMKAAQKFMDIKNRIQDFKVELDEVKEKILLEMHETDRSTLKITVGVENYRFEIKPGEEDLRCVKETKTPVVKIPAGQQEL